MPPFLAYIVLLLAIIGFIGLGLLITQLGSKHCNLGICKKHGKFIRDGMNKTVDPCDDFYKFVCSNFNPNGETIQGMIIESKYRIVGDYLTPEINYKKDGKISQVAKIVYRPCTKESLLEKQGTAPLARIIEGMGSIPFLDSRWNKEKADTFTVGKADIKLFRRGIPSSFFDIRSTMFPLEQHVVLSIPRTLVHSFKPDPSQWVKFSAEFLTQWNKIKESNKTLSKKDKKDIFEAAKFKWALMDLIKHKKNCSRAPYKYVSVEYLTKITNRDISISDQRLRNILLDWISERCLNNPLLTQNPVIFIGEFDAYLHGLVKLLNGKKYTMHAIANFLGIQSLLSFYPLMPKVFREITEKYLIANENQTTITDYRISKNRELLCAKTIHEVLVTELSSQFLNDYPRVISSETRTLYNIQVTKILSVIKDLVRSMKWIDEKDKMIMADKLDNISYNIPLPDSVFKDMDDRTAFERIYMRYCTNIQSALDTYLSLRKALLETMALKKVGWSIYYIDPEYDAFGSHLYFDNGRQSIVSPLPFTAYPAFGWKWPKHTNFAGLGVWMAQRIFREVLGYSIPDYFPEEETNTEDSSTDKNSHSYESKSWWKNKTDVQYRARRLCMYNEYNTFLQPYRVKSNDPNCLEDSVAYAGAVQAAYHAYRAFTRNRFFFEAKLPYMRDYNIDQYFFIKYASSFCDNKDTKYNMTRDSAVFVPNHFIVLATLRNFPKFADVFKCKTGSRMNPTTKCLMWRN